VKLLFRMRSPLNCQHHRRRIQYGIGYHALRAGSVSSWWTPIAFRKLRTNWISAERAAIALAAAINADLLLMDEAAGRAEAKRRNLRVTGTLGVLRTAAERGLVNVPHLIVRLKATSFYTEDALLKSVFGRWL